MFPALQAASGQEGSVSDDLADELAYLDELPEPKPGLSEADMRGCRYIEGEATPLRPGLFCGAPVVPGRSWCDAHNRVVWARRARAARKPKAAVA